MLLVWLDELDGRRRGPDDGEDARRRLDELDPALDRVKR